MVAVRELDFDGHHILAAYDKTQFEVSCDLSPAAAQGEMLASTSSMDRAHGGAHPRRLIFAWGRRDCPSPTRARAPGLPFQGWSPPHLKRVAFHRHRASAWRPSAAVHRGFSTGCRSYSTAQQELDQHSCGGLAWTSEPCWLPGGITAALCLDASCASGWLQEGT
jgi:hypothetical protein